MNSNKTFKATEDLYLEIEKDLIVIKSKSFQKEQIKVDFDEIDGLIATLNYLKSFKKN